MQITLTGDVAPHEKSFRARVDGLGVHAYGATSEEAEARALEISVMKLDFWHAAGTLMERLAEFGIAFDMDPQADALPAPRDLIRMDLAPA